MDDINETFDSKSTVSAGPSWKSASNDLRRFIFKRSVSDIVPSADEYAGYKTDSQLYFTHRIDESKKWSLWLTMVLVIVTWNELIVTSQLTPLVADYLENNIICKIPALEKTNWTFEQIKAISHYSNSTSPCYYYNHDYNHISQYPYDQALNVTQSFNNVEIKKCSAYILRITDNRYNYLNEYNLLCYPKYIKSYHLALIGKIVGTCLTGFIADVYGRRFTLLATLPVSVISSVFMALAPTYWSMYALAIVMEASLHGTVAIGIILFLEIVHCEIRIYAVVLVRLGLVCGCFLKVILYHYIQQPGTRLRQLVVNCTFFLPICCLWLLPESVHWLLCIRDWKAMRRVLNEINYPSVLSPSAQIPESSEHETSVPLKEIFRILFKPAFRKKLFLGGFLFSMSYLVYYVETLRLINVTNSVIKFSAIRGICMVINMVLTPLMLTKISRPMCICSCLLVIALFYCGATIYKPYSGAGGYVAAICLVMAQNATLINGLLLIEMFPTRVRATAVGICRSVADVMLLIALVVINFIGVESEIGMYKWMVYATLIVVAAFLCVLITNTGDVPLPDTELQAIYHF